MFTKMTVGKRIALGFSIVLLILGSIAGIGYNKIGYIADLSSLVQSSIKEEGFLVQKEVDHLNWAKKLTGSMLNSTEINVQLDPTKCSFGKWLYELLNDPKLSKRYPAAIIETLKKMEPVHKRLHESAHRIHKNHSTFDFTILDIMEKRWMEHLVWMKELQMTLLTGKSFKGEVDPKQCKFGKWFYSYKTNDPRFMKILDGMKVPHQKLHESARKIIDNYNSGNKKVALDVFNKTTVTEMARLGDLFNSAFVYLGEMKNKNLLSEKIYDKETSPALEGTQGFLKTLRKQFHDHMISIAGNAAEDLAGTAHFARLFVLIAGIIAIIIGIVIAFVIARSITAPIIRISNGLRDSSNQVSSASSQLSGASQELSSSSNQQAASIEETSSSLEEITGMVDNNVDNAKRCVEISQTVSDSSQKGNASMQDLIGSMQDILESNQKIQQLVKVIGEIGEKTQIMDEIVFQTKLLSFNASVEAERAGEHGRGFAVVAQEVGNLAQMSGKAATEISVIVKESIKNAEEITTENRQKVESGNEIVKNSAEILQDISEQSNVLLENINSILSASQDQATGIGQINSAVTQLDKATQENAATAEETASSGEELSAQAENLNSMVQELTTIVTGEVEDRPAHTLVTGAKKKHITPSNVVHLPKDKKSAEVKESPASSDQDEWEVI